MATSKAKPIETVYINNLNDKISLPKLKQQLQQTFDKYGEIIQITAHRNLKMKGQAFITFHDLSAAQAAIKATHNTVLFGKPIHIDFAKTNSDNYYSKIVQDDSIIEKRKKLKEANNVKSQSKKRLADSEPAKVKRAKTIDWKKLPPNKILLLQNLSSSVVSTSVEELFDKFNGFINIRLLKIRNLAFIEFDNEADATNCLNNVDNVALKTLGESCQLTYAKK